MTPALDDVPVAAAAPPFRRRTMLAMLLVVAALSQVDRNIINILAEPMKLELGLQDKQLGLLTGLSFALFYSICGLPIARIADRGSRPKVIGLSILCWSLFTLLSGFATSFLFLLIARVGVGSGEGGSGPASHSLIADITSPQDRASALATVAMGSPLGVLIGFFFGGLIADAHGWRMAFVIAAAPGLAIGVVMLLLKDPRDRSPGHRAAHRRAVVGLGETLAALRGKRAFWWVCAGGAGTAFVLYGLSNFYASFYVRNHAAGLAGLGAAKGSMGILGMTLGLINGVAGVLGVFLGGRATDRATRRDLRGYCLVPTVALLTSTPCFALALLVPNLLLSFACLFVAALLQLVCLAPAYASVQTLAPPAMRATAAAIFLFVVTIVGAGLGPLATGILSDAFQPVLGTASGLRAAMLAVTPAGLIAAACYWRARRTLLAEVAG